MPRDEDVIHTFWHGRELSSLGHACLQSFVERGHAVRVHVYDPVTAPPGVVVEDAREVVDIDDPMYRMISEDTVAMFADYFRYRLLHQRGGWWVDTDVYCLTDRLPSEPYAWAEQEPGFVNNAILKFPKGDPLCARLATLALSRGEPEARWGALGPELVTEVLGPRRRTRRTGSRDTFYPIHFLEAHFLWLPECEPVVTERSARALFIHCWAKALDLMGIDASRTPPEGSFLARMMASVRPARGSTAWHRFRTRRSIRRFLQQDWVKRYWANRVTLHEPGLDVAPEIPTPEVTVAD